MESICLHVMRRQGHYIIMTDGGARILLGTVIIHVMKNIKQIEIVNSQMDLLIIIGMAVKMRERRLLFGLREVSWEVFVMPMQLQIWIGSLGKH